MLLPLSTNIGQLVDAALNNPEWEFVSCSVRLINMGHKTKGNVLSELRECAKDLEIEVNETDLDQAFESIKENVELLYGTR